MGGNPCLIKFLLLVLVLIFVLYLFLFSNKECSWDPLGRGEEISINAFRFYILTFEHSWNYIYCCFFLSHFRGNVDVQGHVKECTKIISFAGSSKFNDHRYGGICPYHAPVPHLQPEEEKLEVLSKSSASFAIISMGKPARTIRSYRQDDETPNFVEGTSKFRNRHYG